MKKYMYKYIDILKSTTYVESGLGRGWQKHVHMYICLAFAYSGDGNCIYINNIAITVALLRFGVSVCVVKMQEKTLQFIEIHHFVNMIFIHQPRMCMS